MSVCSWDLKWNLLLHTKLFKQIHGQKKAGRGAQKMRLCVRVCSSHSEKPKKKKKKNQSRALRKEMYKKVKRVKGYHLALSRGFGASGKQRNASR